MPNFLEPTAEDLIGAQIDITRPKAVEVRLRNDGSVLWINVDGVCVLRCCQIKNMELIDERTNGAFNLSDEIIGDGA
jgi:hypothetical protein